jgi:Ca2+-binding EF-hand superfamily protein
MTIRRALPVAALALALAGCSSLFGSNRHREAPPEEYHPPRTILEAFDANHDGTVTRAEMDAGLKADFAKADTNHDGRLDEDEVRAVNLARWTADSSTASPLVDWNHDGFVDFKEFAATAHSLFDQMDADGDGKLSPQELRPRRPSMRAPGGQRGERGRGGDGPEGGGDPDGD